MEMEAEKDQGTYVYGYRIIDQQDDGDPLKGFNRGGCDPTCSLDASLAWISFVGLFR